MNRRIATLGVVAGLCTALAVWAVARGLAADKKPAEPSTRPSKDAAMTEYARNLKSQPAKTEVATFAAGCFWGVETTFRKVPGVLSTEVGYTGGKTKDPTYRDVCTDLTGHAEALRVEYDPEKVSYQKLMEVFFENHDPTTLNRQGPDEGAQYRSAIFYNSPEQKKAAEAEKAKRNASGEYVAPIVTEIVEAAPFYRAEEYHQEYYEKKGLDWQCHFGNGKKRQFQKQ
jgi:peptide-methionine (S)-S-oxide reductase